MYLLDSDSTLEKIGLCPQKWACFQVCRTRVFKYANILEAFQTAGTQVWIQITSNSVSSRWFQPLSIEKDEIFWQRKTLQTATSFSSSFVLIFCCLDPVLDRRGNNCKSMDEKVSQYFWTGCWVGDRFKAAVVIWSVGSVANEVQGCEITWSVYLSFVGLGQGLYEDVPVRIRCIRVQEWCCILTETLSVAFHLLDGDWLKSDARPRKSSIQFHRTLKLIACLLW